MIEVDAFTSYAYFANNIPFTSPFGGITTTANTIQLAIQDVETRKATLASPTFTGLVNVPTAPTTTSNTVVASTAYVTNRLGDGGTYAHNITGNAGTATTAGAVPASGITGQTGMWTSTTRPGPYRLYRRDNNSDYSVQTYWTGSLWRLYGYNGDTAHADVHVGYADSAGSASSATSATTASTANALKTDNNYQMNALWVGGGTVSHTGGEIKATGNITAYVSDERLKNNLGKIENALDKIEQLTGFYYELNDVAKGLGLESKGREVGVSAQKVQSVQPEAVAAAPIDENYLTVRYERLVPLIIEAIKELKSEVEVLKGQIK
jgi:hypothetical protein